jgi:hypothetical protein
MPGEVNMKTLAWMTAGVMALAAVGLVAAGAYGQYYTPLRYDLRYTSPTYIPSGVMRFGPSDHPDPYAFGAPQYGNLGITGNLRLGKSFQGNVPYGQIGSQFAGTLPTDSLSRFKRDSFGVADIGTNVEYGIPEAYFPGSGSVTNLPTAENRFTVPPLGNRAPYTLPNLNTPFMGYRPRPSGDFLGYNVAEGVHLPAGMGQTQIGMSIPAASLSWVDALIAGRIRVPQSMAAAAEDAEKERQRDKRLGLPRELPDLRLGLRLPAAPEEELVPPKEVEAKKAEEAGIETPGEPGQFWLTPPPKREKSAAGAAIWPTQEPPSAKAPPRKPSTPPEEAAPPEPGGPAVPPIPGPYKPVASYGVYMGRAGAAMKQSGYDEAEALYAAAESLEPNRPDAFFGRLYAIIAMRNYLQASLVIQNGLARHPEWAKAVPNIQTAYSDPEVYARTVASLKAFLQGEPKSLGYNFLLGFVYYASGDMAAARPCLERVANLRGEKPGPEKTILSAMEGRQGR